MLYSYNLQITIFSQREFISFDDVWSTNNDLTDLTLCKKTTVVCYTRTLLRSRLSVDNLGAIGTVVGLSLGKTSTVLKCFTG